MISISYKKPKREDPSEAFFRVDMHPVWRNFR